jgi:hypothetical protein
MKKNYLIALTLLCFILIKVQAQKIVMDKDTVMKDGVKLFIVKTAKKVSILDTEGIPEYSIRNMDNKELIYFKDNSLIFLNNGAKATYDGKPKALPLAKHINEHELITNNQLNETAQNNYLIKFAYKELVTAAKDANGLIVCNRTAPVIISVSTIKQDNVIIGKITQDTRYTNGISEIVFEIKQPDGTLIATAYAKDYTATSVSIVTVKDNKTHYNSFQYFAQAQESIINFLIQKLYL